MALDSDSDSSPSTSMGTLAVSEGRAKAGSRCSYRSSATTLMSKARPFSRRVTKQDRT